VARFDVSAFSGLIAGEIPGDPATRLRPAAVTGDRVVDLALVAAREAWSDAGVDESGVPRDRIAVVVGTSSGSLAADEITEAKEQADPLGTAALKSWAHHRRIAVAVADALGAEGPRFTLSSACTSGNVALALAADLLDTGQSDLVLVGGADGMSRRKYAGFDALGAIAPVGRANGLGGSVAGSRPTPFTPRRPIRGAGGSRGPSERPSTRRGSRTVPSAGTTPTPPGRS
jgi:3-oxoacyl-[acyl-carrier-protein] synthase II